MPDEKGIKKVIYKAYNFTLPVLIKKINDDAKRVSITTDMWTARNGQGYIGVTCSYIDAKFNLNEITLTVNYVRYPHTAQHIAESLEETFNEWNLQDKVFTITTDNAANIKKVFTVTTVGDLTLDEINAIEGIFNVYQEETNYNEFEDLINVEDFEQQSNEFQPEVEN